MKFLIDNVLSPLVAASLRKAGYDAAHVRDYGMEASEDEDILLLAVRESRILISADTDFGALLAVAGHASPSVILLRRTSQRRPQVQASLLLANLPGLRRELNAGVVVLLEQSRVRVRRLPIPPAPSRRRS